MSSLLAANTGLIKVWNDTVGMFISDEFQRIAEIIADYDPELRLVYLPAPSGEEIAEPFAIMHTNNQGAQYIVRRLGKDDVNPNLVEWLFLNDVTKQGKADDILTRMDARIAARKAMELKRQLDEHQEKLDFANVVFKGKNYFRHNGKTYS